MLRKIVRSLIAGAGAAGALALVNRGLAGGLPISHLEGMQHRWKWRDGEIFAAEAGQGQLLVLIHGLHPGASSYQYRELFPLLARRHRVVAFDFLGCGLSDKPQLDYVAELFVEQILDAVGEFTDGRAVAIASSLGAAFAIRAAARAPERFSHLVAICPASHAGYAGPWTSTFRAPVFGESLYNLIASKRSIRWFLASEGYGDPSRVTPQVVDAYHAVMHQPGARWVPFAFVGGRLDCDVARDLPFVEAPVLIVWGKRAKTNPARNAREYAELARNAEIELYANSALLPQEEEAEALASRIESFIRRG